MSARRDQIIRATRRAAQRNGINPDLFSRQIGAESNFDPNAGSSAGARDVAQMMPATAKGLGVTLGDGRVNDDLNGAAGLMSRYLKQYNGSWPKALTAYNAGPGRVGKPLYAETSNYIRKILGGQDVTAGAAPAAPAATPAAPGPATTSARVEDPVLQHKQFFAQWMAKKDPTNPLVKLGVLDPNMATTRTVTGTSPMASAATVGQVGGVVRGAGHGAVDFARQRIGHYAESGGANRGPELDKLQGRFGMTGQAWCAMFATTAAAHGGASRSVRTPSVAMINQWASQGSNGYQRGLRPSTQARPGDLLTLGNGHVGLVERVEGGVIHTIEGNTSSGKVTRVTRRAGQGKIARPSYR